MTDALDTAPEGALTEAAGTVVSLRRYPVESMLGEEIGGSAVSERGLAGDRAYALIDRETGTVANAKNAETWPNLSDCSAAYLESPVVDRPPPPAQITLPGGATVRTDDSDVHEVLSQVVGRAVTLTQAPFDAAPLALLTTATLSHLGEVYPQGSVEAARVRPNIVVDVEGAEPGSVENEWVGHTLAVGDDVQVAAAGLGDDPGVGVHATVVAVGSIRRGDPVSVA